jgi:hypothetical protein
MLYILARKENGTLTGIAISLSDDGARAIAADGDYAVIPIVEDRLYTNIISLGITGAIEFQNTALSTYLQQARNAIQNIQGDIAILQGSVNSLQQSGVTIINRLNDLDARVLALENP